MAYQVLARKYRPQRFSDVVGQEHVTQTLAQAIRQKRIAHAYIFCGPRGTGKTTIARIFAKCLNCTNGPSVEFDDADPKCVEIAEGTSMDVLEIDGASNNGVEQVRELRDTVKYLPASSRYKIFIIDEVHMLSTAAFNALLKTLEEPPDHVKFLFATTDPEKVLVTILSRCQRFDLRRIPAQLIVQQLARIALAEQVQVEDAALHAIARGCDGGMRDAESALDQLISFCGSQIVEADVLSMYGLTAQTQLLSLAGAVLAGDAARALRELDAAAHAGKDLGRLVGDLLRHFRNLLLFQVTQGDASLVEASEAELAALKEQSAGVSAEALTRIMDVLSECEINLREAASRKILIELALLKAIQARGAVSLDTVLKQLNQLRAEAPPAGGAPAPIPAPAPGGLRAAVEARMTAQTGSQTPAAPEARATPAPPPPAARAAMTLEGEGLERLWQEMMAGLEKSNKILHTTLTSAFPVSLANDVLTIGMGAAQGAQMGMVNTPSKLAVLQARLRELGCANAQIKVIAMEPPAARPPAAAPAAAAPAPGKANGRSEPADLNDFKIDPKITKALEIFRGTLAQAASAPAAT